MKIEIVYCTAWNYRPEADRVSLELKSENDMEILLVPGSSGVFDVSVNGIVVFSKNKIGRFPNKGEIRELLT